MKIILLPGLDGTGLLFAELLPWLSQYEYEVLALPAVGDQSYAVLTATICKQLPQEDFILVAESFAGPIGAALANKGVKNMKGIIFVATFLSSPRPTLLKLLRYMPLKYLATLPFAGYAHKVLFLGPNTSAVLLERLRRVIKALPSRLITARLNTLLTLKLGSTRCDLPALYIQPSSDKLVPPNKAIEFVRNFSDITIAPVAGPHFILQANPAECANIMAGFITQQISTNHE